MRLKPFRAFAGLSLLISRSVQVWAGTIKRERSRLLFDALTLPLLEIARKSPKSPMSPEFLARSRCGFRTGQEELPTSNLPTDEGVNVKSIFLARRVPAPALILVILPVIGLFFAPHAQANLVLNGSFELPGVSGTSGFGPGREQYSAPSVALTNWTVTGQGDVFLHKSPDIGNDAGSSFNFAQNGNFYLDLSGSYLNSAHATVFQDFLTTPLSTYELSFYIGAAQTPPAATINVQLSGGASLLNATLTPLTPSTNINWMLETFSFVTDSATTRLSFRDVSTSDDNASFVDNVSVVSTASATPAPSTLVMASILFGMFGAVWTHKRLWRTTTAA